MSNIHEAVSLREAIRNGSSAYSGASLSSWPMFYGEPIPLVWQADRDVVDVVAIIYIPPGDVKLMPVYARPTTIPPVR